MASMPRARGQDRWNRVSANRGRDPECQGSRIEGFVAHGSCRRSAGFSGTALAVAPPGEAVHAMLPEVLVRGGCHQL